MKTKLRIFGLVLLMLTLFTVTAFAAEDGGSPYGALSLLPPLLAIALAFLTKQVILSLFLGIFSGVMMLNGYNPFISFLRTLDSYILGSLADGWNAGIIIFTLSIGGMIGIIGKMGGTKAIADALAKKAQNARSAQLVTTLMGILVFFDDYANTLIVGPTMRPLTDKMNVSREKLSYIVDSTAAPVAGMAFISTWIGYEIGLISDVFTGMGIEGNFFMVFLNTIPYAFYNIFTLVLIYNLILQGRDYGPMYAAEVRARTTGKVLGDNAKPMSTLDTEEFADKREIKLQVSNAVVPIAVLILTTFFGLWYNGWVLGEGSIPFSDIRGCFGNADASVVLIWSAVLGSIVAGVMAWARKIMNIGEILDSWVDGCKSLLITAIILILAWSIGGVVGDVGTADFLIQVVSTTVPAILLPILVFGISCIVAFSTGTSWGTMAIVVPLAVPLATAYVTGDPTTSTLVLATLSAVLSGSIFGDHCSPISDTTIMSSMASGADHMDHVKTQIPYALTGAAFAMVSYLIVGFLESFAGDMIALVFGFVGIYIFVKIVGKKTDEVTLEQN
ncbi:MAG: Na+/H+ antiporter [Clostridiales bacterium 38_11]|nr:MAG: Na+/H+ antiporter [Clostridiales bacterium 38_11]HBH12042.1 sodium:proton antiporter [Clostridiales bacterium]